MIHATEKRRAFPFPLEFIESKIWKMIYIAVSIICEMLHLDVGRNGIFHFKSIVANAFLSILNSRFILSSHISIRRWYANFKRKWDFHLGNTSGVFTPLKFPKAHGQSQSNAFPLETVFISLVNSFRFAITLPRN